MVLLNAALTVGNVIKALQGIYINWKKLAKILCIPDSECLKISNEYSGHEECGASVIRCWLLQDPLASWRRIIDKLYWHGESRRATMLHSYAEKLNGNHLVKFMIHSIL